MPGWSEAEVKVGTTTFAELPPNAQAYVRKIEELCECTVKYIQLGGMRDDDNDNFITL